MGEPERIGGVPSWTFGDRLQKARTHAGFTQPELAALLSVSTPAISKWETDRGVPRDLLSVVQRWAEVTGVDPRWILWGDVEGPGGSVTLGQAGLLGAVALPDGQLELPLHALDMRDQLAVVDA